MAGRCRNVPCIVHFASFREVWADGEISTAYNNMHKTELERWLSDHDIPYPSPADRKDLEKIVKDNWSAKVSTPYTDWDIGRLQQYLKDRGYEATDSAAETKEGLLSRVKANWHESEDQTHEKYASVKDYIFSTFVTPAPGALGEPCSQILQLVRFATPGILGQTQHSRSAPPYAR